MNFRSLILFSPLFLCILFIACNNRKNEFLPVPSNAEIIVKVDGDRLSKKILWDKAKDLNIWDLFKSGTEDTSRKQTPLEMLLKDPGKAGIAYMEDFYFFRKDGFFYLAVFLDDEEDFKHFLKKHIGSEVTRHNKIYTSSNSDFAVSFTNDVALFCPADSQATLRLEKFYSLPIEGTPFSTSPFTLDSLRESDVLFTANLSKLGREFTISPELIKEFASSQNMIGSLNFEDGKMDLEVYRLVNASAERLLGPVNTEVMSQFQAGNWSAVAGLHINPDAVLHRAVSDSLNSETYKIGIGEKELLKSFTGEAFLKFYGIKDTIKVFTTYGFDDDLNKVEKKDTSIASYPSFELKLKFKDSVSPANALAQLKSRNILDAAGKNYELKLTEIPIYIFQTKEFIMLTEKPALPLQEETLPNNMAIAPVGLYARVLPQNIYKEWQPAYVRVKEASIWFDRNKRGLVFHGQVIFEDQEKNGLLSFMKFLKEYKPVKTIHLTI